MSNGETIRLMPVHAVVELNGPHLTIDELRRGTVKAFVFFYLDPARPMLGFDLKPIPVERWQGEKGCRFLENGHMLGRAKSFVEGNDGDIYIEAIDKAHELKKNKGGRRPSDNWAKVVCALWDISGWPPLPDVRNDTIEKIFDFMGERALGRTVVAEFVQYIYDYRDKKLREKSNDQHTAL